MRRKRLFALICAPALLIFLTSAGIMALTTPAGATPYYDLSVQCTAQLSGTAATGTNSYSPTVSMILTCNWNGNLGSDNELQGVIQAGSELYGFTLTNVTTYTNTTNDGTCATTCSWTIPPASGVATVTSQTLGTYTTLAEDYGLWHSPVASDSIWTTPPAAQPGYVCVNNYDCEGPNADLAGVITVSTAFGATPTCTPTGQSGFYSATADGVKSFAYTYTYDGTPTAIVGAPVDKSTGTVTLYGKTFPADSTEDLNPTTSPTTINVTPAQGADPNATNFWCYDGTTWWNWGNAYSGGSGETPQATNGCDLTSMTGEDPHLGSDQDYTATFQNDNQSWLVFEYESYLDVGNSPPDFYASQTLEGKAFADDFSVEQIDTSATAPTIDLPVDLTDATSQDGEDGPVVVGAEVWCYSTSASQWDDLGTLSSLLHNPAANPNPPSNGSGTVDCSNFPALDLSFDIGTDLGNTAKWGICAVEWLVVPTSWSAILPTDLNGKPPFVWVSDLAAAINTMSTGLNSALASGACAAPSVQPFSLLSNGIFSHSYLQNFTIALPAPTDAGCPATYANENAGELFGYRIWLRDVELFGLYISFIAIIWRLLPWSDNSDARVIETFGSLNNDGDYIETHQTNEGSD